MGFVKANPSKTASAKKLCQNEGVANYVELDKSELFFTEALPIQKNENTRIFANL